MRIDLTGINRVNFILQPSISVADDKKFFSDMIDELSDEMSKTDADSEYTKSMDYFYLSEKQISLGLQKRDMFPVVLAAEEASYIRPEYHGDNSQSFIVNAINAYHKSMGIYE